MTFRAKAREVDFREHWLIRPGGGKRKSFDAQKHGDEVPVIWLPATYGAEKGGIKGG